MDSRKIELLSYENHVSFLKGELEEIKCEFRELQKQTEEQIEDNLQLANTYVIDLERERSEMVVKLQNQEEMIKQLQESNFRMQDHTEWMSVQDSDITNKMNALERAIRDWSMKHVVMSLAEIDLVRLFSNENVSFERAWSDIIHFPLENLPGGLDTPDMACTTPWLLISAWLTSFVYTWVVSNPYFFVGDFLNETTGHRHTEDFGNMLRDFTTELEKCKCAGFPSRICFTERLGYGRESLLVNTLRSQLLRLLDPTSVEGMPVYATATKQAVAKAKAAFVSNISRKFLKDAFHCLQDPESELIQIRLESIFNLATELALVLWTQRSYVSCSGLKTLRNPPRPIRCAQPSSTTCRTVG
jgi:hypothetical protein